MILKLAKIAGLGMLISIICLIAASLLAGPDIARSVADWTDRNGWDVPDEEAAQFGTGKTREVSGFTGIEARAGSDVEVTIGEEFSVEVLDSNPERVVTRLNGSNLVITPRPKASWWGMNYSGSAPHVRVTMPAVEVLKASTAAEIGASDIDADDIELSASTGSSIDVSGVCKTLDASISTGAKIDADDLICETGKAEASTGGELRVHVSGKLDVDASTGGEIEASGNPQIGRLSLSSGGDLDLDD